MTTASNTRLLDLGLEALEHRRLLAGNVQAAVTGGGDLVIAGDNDGNLIRVTTLASGEFRVDGLDGTTVNGNSSTETFSGVTDDLRINLRNGQNFLLFDELSVPDLLSIRTGSGNDRITFNGDGGFAQSIGGDLNINTGSGSDGILTILHVADISVGEDLTINTGSGSDSIFLRLIVTDGRVSINTGSGNDSLSFIRDGGISAINNGRVRIAMGDGSDVVNFLGVVSTDRLDINTGSGSDSVNIQATSVTERLTINLGRDDDELIISGVPSTDIQINGGSGFDASDTPASLLEDMRNFESSVTND